MFWKKLDNLKNKPAGVLQTFYDQVPTLPASDDITRFDGMSLQNVLLAEEGGQTDFYYIRRNLSLKEDLSIDANFEPY